MKIIYLQRSHGIENVICRIALGRKNYLFSGNDSGAEDNCIFYTFIGSCLQAGVDPHRWLTSTLEKILNLKIPIDREELLSYTLFSTQKSQ